jgi:hypothetical protein
VNRSGDRDVDHRRKPRVVVVFDNLDG